MCATNNVTNLYDTELIINTTESQFLENMIEVANSMFIIYIPILVVMGTIGNLICIFVFLKSKLRILSISQYLTALATSDTIFLFLLIPPWLHAMQWTEIFNTHGFCQIFIYLSYVTCSSSIWIVAAFSFERLVAIIYPLQRNAICTIKRARYIILVIITMSALVNIPVVKISSSTIDDYCDILEEHIDFAEKFNLMDTIVSFTIPLGIIIFLNTWIGIGVYRVKKARRELMNEPPQLPRPLRSRKMKVSSFPRSQLRVTTMLLFVSTVFVSLNLPAYTMRILAYKYNLAYKDTKWGGVQQLTMMLFYTNFGINFILYCLCGQNFRHALMQVMPWLQTVIGRKISVRRGTVLRRARASSLSTSYITNCTEATTDGTQGNQNLRSRWQGSFIAKWTFDNSRQRQQRQQQTREHYEMQVISSNTLENAM